MRQTFRRLGVGVSLVCAGAAALVSNPACARITRIEITATQSPTFQGQTFATVGSYEKLRGRAYGEIDPADNTDEKIVDIENAPRNAAGKVEYSLDFLVIRPVDAAQANRRVFYELTNRGTILSLRVMDAAPSFNNDPTSAADAGYGSLLRQGYTLLFSGWESTAPAGGGRYLFNAPVAKNADGSPIVGPALEELAIDNSTTQVAPLTYPAATTDTTQAQLTVRTHYDDPPVSIPASGWAYVNNRSVRLLPAGTPFQQGRLYELRYQAMDPTVAGLGFAAVRDLAEFLKSADTDDLGNPNPTRRMDQVYAFAVSQPARFLRDFVDLGFNRVGKHGKALDGILNWIAGASGGFFNYRFAQPARTHRQHIGRWTPERQFPFAWQIEFDPVTDQVGGRISTCLATHTCPRILEANSSNEYWVKGTSLLHTNTRGHDIHHNTPNVRYYLFASRPHQTGTGNGICQQPLSELSGGIGLRALLLALDQWVTSNRQPPPSEVPTRADGTLVAPLPQSAQGFPNIPGVKYTGLMTTGDLLDFGPQFKDGILTTLPPAVTSPYPVFVPKTDADGNDLAGVRFPDIDVPVATYTGWALRAAAFGGDDLCDGFGQAIPFAKTKAERLASGDPRLSLEERYPSHQDYVSKVSRAAHKLAERRLMLQEDVDRVVADAQASSIGN